MHASPPTTYRLTSASTQASTPLKHCAAEVLPSLALTARRRPELLAARGVTDEERRLLAELGLEAPPRRR